MKRTAVLFWSITAALVSPGSAVEAAGDPRAAQLTYEPWVKMCLKQADGSSDCFVGTGARGACDPSGGGFSIVTNGKNVSLSVTLRTRRTLEGAISVRIDQGEKILIPHAECKGLVCYGRVPVDSGFGERLKQSQTVTIEATDTTHQEVGLSLSLADFAQAYDGPASEPKVFETVAVSKEKFKEDMERQEEERKARECKE